MPRLAGFLEQLRKLLGGATSTDDELLQRFVRDHDQDAFAALVDRYGGMVMGVCRRALRSEQDTEDAFQATFLVLARKARSLNGRGTLAKWLYTVARNTAFKAKARAYRQRERQVETVPEPTADEHNWDGIGPVLDEELNRLPDRYRGPMLLCCFMGKTHEEAARELGYSRFTVLRRLEEGRDLLRARLTRRGLALALPILAPDVLAAAVPAALAQSTLKTALALPAAKTAATSRITKGTGTCSDSVPAEHVPVPLSITECTATGLRS